MPKSNFSDFGQKPWTIVRRFDQISLRTHNSSLEGARKLKFSTFCSCSKTMDCSHTLTPSRYLNDSQHHTIIYRKSDLDLSSVTGATCGSNHKDIHKNLFETQQRQTERLTKRQTNFDPLLVRCRLLVIGDYEFFLEHSDAGDSLSSRTLSASSRLLSFISTVTGGGERGEGWGGGGKCVFFRG